MNLCFYSMSELNFDELMRVYEEGNIQKGAILYPYESATMQKYLAERDFEDYLRQTFFKQNGAVYFVFEENSSYISAGRIEPFNDGYLLSALETRPDYRAKGYGKRLLAFLVSTCSLQGKIPIYSHVHCNNHASMNLHMNCGFRVYKDVARYLDGTVRSDGKTLIYEK